nr:site-specific integrase [uncultured Desulfuromonas sp.]
MIIFSNISSAIKYKGENYFTTMTNEQIIDKIKTTQISDNIEKDWCDKHIPDLAYRKNESEIIELYNTYAPIYREVELESIRVRARAYYGLQQDIPVQPQPTQSVSLPKANPTPTVKIIYFTELVDQYTTEMVAGGNWTAKTKAEQLQAYALFVQLQGDVDISDINTATITAYKNQLLKLPKNAHKKPETRDIPFSDLVAMDHGLPTVSITSINKYITKLSALLSWASKNGYIDSNPASGTTIKQKKTRSTARLPYSFDDLSMIATSRIYTRRNRHEYYYWLPLLAIYTGARLNELAQLDVSDIRTDNGIWYIDINDDSEGKRLKNASAKRKIPIHSKLIEMGFLAYVKSRSKAMKLFDGLKIGPHGYGTSASKWWCRHAATIKFDDADKKCFHSFRHSFADAIKRTDIPEHVAFGLMGHNNPTMTYGLYGSDIDITVLKDNIEKITFDVAELNSIHWEP